MVIDKALIADRIGHGLGSTRWNRDRCIVFLSELAFYLENKCTEDT